MDVSKHVEVVEAHKTDIAVLEHSAGQATWLEMRRRLSPILHGVSRNPGGENFYLDDRVYRWRWHFCAWLNPDRHRTTN